jgi:hypothetical protein
MISPGGTTLAAAGDDSTVQLWPVALWASPYQALCAETRALPATARRYYAPSSPAGGC